MRAPGPASHPPPSVPSLPAPVDVLFMALPSPRTHANGSIKRGSKDNATDSVPLRTGIGVQLKDIKVFNRDRQKGEARGAWPWVLTPRTQSEGAGREVRPKGALPRSPGDPGLASRGWGALGPN